MKEKLQNIYVAVVAAVVLCLSGMVAPGGACDATSRPPAVVADGGQLCDASLWVRETGDKLASAAAATTINATPVGNIRLHVCFTADHEFAAVQMLRFGDYQYRAVTRPRVLEGAAARAFMDFILKTNKKP